MGVGDRSGFHWIKVMELSRKVPLSAFECCSVRDGNLPTDQVGIHSSPGQYVSLGRYRVAKVKTAPP